MPRRSFRRINASKVPTAEEYDHMPLLDALKSCREQVRRYSNECGIRTPARREAEVLVMTIDALAKLVRHPGSAQYVTPPMTEAAFTAESGIKQES